MIQAHIETPMRKLGFFQRLQLRQAAEQHFTADMLAVIAMGYSDIGAAGMRSAWEMKAVRRILRRHKLLFSCVSLIALSDEAICLYNHAFSMGIPLREAVRIIGDYCENVHRIRKDTTRANWISKVLKIAGFYRRALLDIASIAV